MIETDRTKYLSKDFFEKVLQSNFKLPNITVKNVKLSSACPLGDNFASQIYRVNLNYRTDDQGSDKDISLIVKILRGDEDEIGSCYNIINIYEKEVHIYTEILPKMSEILNGEFVGAKIYYASETPFQFIVLQDLKSLGYEMADRKTGLDAEHCRLTLEKLARIHVASMKLAENNTNIMDLYFHGIFRQEMVDSPVLEGIYGKNITSLIEMASKWSGFEESVEKMKIFRKNFLQILTDYCNNTPCAFKVLNHGDAWVNNFMYKYENGRPVDVVFLDYQFSYYSSPGIDLNFFLSTSPQFDVPENNREQLIDGYVKTFFNKLCELNYKNSPSMEIIKNEITNRELYGFFAASCSLPMVLSKNLDINLLIKEDGADDMRNAMYTGSKYQQIMKTLLKRYQDLNIFDTI